jgi:hypothetical protein
MANTFLFLRDVAHPVVETKYHYPFFYTPPTIYTPPSGPPLLQYTQPREVHNTFEWMGTQRLVPSDAASQAALWTRMFALLDAHITHVLCLGASPAFVGDELWHAVRAPDGLTLHRLHPPFVIPLARDVAQMLGPAGSHWLGPWFDAAPASPLAQELREYVRFALCAVRVVQRRAPGDQNEVVRVRWDLPPVEWIDAHMGQLQGLGLDERNMRFIRDSAKYAEEQAKTDPIVE